MKAILAIFLALFCRFSFADSPIIDLRDPKELSAILQSAKRIDIYDFDYTSRDSQLSKDVASLSGVLSRPKDVHRFSTFIGDTQPKLVTVHRGRAGQILLEIVVDRGDRRFRFEIWSDNTLLFARGTAYQATRNGRLDESFFTNLVLLLQHSWPNQVAVAHPEQIDYSRIVWKDGMIVSAPSFPLGTEIKNPRTGDTWIVGSDGQLIPLSKTPNNH